MPKIHNCAFKTNLTTVKRKNKQFQESLFYHCVNKSELSTKNYSVQEATSHFSKSTITLIIKNFFIRKKLKAAKRPTNYIWNAASPTKIKVYL